MLWYPIFKGVLTVMFVVLSSTYIFKVMHVYKPGLSMDNYNYHVHLMFSHFGLVKDDRSCIIITSICDCLNKNLTCSHSN